MGMNSLKKLHDNRCRDIGHDIQCKDGHPTERAAREHIEHAENTASLLLEDILQDRRIDSRQRNPCTKPIDDERTQCKPDALLQLGSLRKVRKVNLRGKLFGG